jgi:methionyl-tRNA formyltransferase
VAGAGRGNPNPFMLFEGTPRMDDGDIYIKDYITLNGDELVDEIRMMQANKTLELCLRFIQENKTLSPIKQSGTETFYQKRNPEHSELDINKTISEQFNLLRIVDNEDYPAFFIFNDKKYIVKIYKDS